MPSEALARDLAALRQGGIRIGYSRRPEIQGYYLQYPSLQRPSTQAVEVISWELIEALRQLSVPEKTNTLLPPPLSPCARNICCWPKNTPTGQRPK